MFWKVRFSLKKKNRTTPTPHFTTPISSWTSVHLRFLDMYAPEQKSPVRPCLWENYGAYTIVFIHTCSNLWFFPISLQPMDNVLWIIYLGLIIYMNTRSDLCTNLSIIWDFLITLLLTPPNKQVKYYSFSFRTTTKRGAGRRKRTTRTVEAAGEGGAVGGAEEVDTGSTQSNESSPAPPALQS